MSKMLYPFIPYPDIEAHGVIGDRRTAALVAADGTIDWFCAPDYDGTAVFGCLVDADQGGSWRFGPEGPHLGEQKYLESTAALITLWQLPTGTLELCDAMPNPEDDRRQAQQTRSIVRRLRCLSGRVSVVFELIPSISFQAAPVPVRHGPGSLSLPGEAGSFGMWTSFPVESRDGALKATLELAEGDVLWAEFGLNLDPVQQNARQLEARLEETVAYWRNWCNGLALSPQERSQIERSAITVHLLTFAPAGSAVAAVTSSLPERIGGDRNWDYRFAWVRDTSLSLALLALLRKEKEISKYLDWLSHRESLVDAPLQVMYHPDGRPRVDPQKLPHLSGYRNSRPVRMGNSVYTEKQHGAVGYLADCTLIYLENGGAWRTEYWELISRCADHTARIWTEPDNGIWEMGEPAQWVSSKLMSWVVLDRAIRIAGKVGRAAEAERWKQTREEISQEILARGWSEGAQSFRQHYGNDEVDAAALLIPVMEFLPPDHDKVAATLRRIEQELCINGFVHRFKPATTPGIDTDLPIGVFECAFFPTTFWLATTYAKAGRCDEADAILARCQQVAGAVGLFAEGVDAYTQTFRGNTPLIFSQVEYARARLALAHHRSLRGTSLDPGSGGGT